MRLIYFLSLMSLSLMTSCSDIFVSDISDSKVVLMAPADSSRSDHYTQTFLWEKVTDAEKYNLQIVMPSFDHIDRFVVDTNISLTQFSLTLYPGTFTWRVKAFNSEYATDYTTAVLFIDTTQNLDNVILQSPDNGIYTKDTIIQFTWSPNPNADSYRFDVIIGENSMGPYFTREDHLVFPDQLSSTPKLPEGVVIWKVRALSVGSQSAPGERTLTIDRTAPGKPVLTEPVNEDTVLTATVDFSWQHTSTGGSPISHVVTIYRDTTSTVIRSDTTRELSWQTTEMSQGKYTWQVYSFDAAGNVGINSEKRKFIIKLSQ